MRFVTYTQDGTTHAGVLSDAGILPVRSLAPDLPDTLAGLVAMGDDALAALEAGVASGSVAPIAVGDVRLEAPFPRPARNVFCVGKNYYDHAAEFESSGYDASSGGQEIPSVPIIFTKAPSSVIGPNGEVESALDATGTLDYEGELTVVIGRGGRGISKADAFSHIFGYTIINDVTARETQSRHKQWFLGKSFDTFCPMGPALVTRDEMEDLDARHLVTKVNGETRQDTVIADLIFDIPTLIETISASITLEPGDLIATGTPAGVGIGFKPPRYLRPGDRVDITIDGIGTLSNTVI